MERISADANKAMAEILKRVRNRQLAKLAVDAYYGNAMTGQA